MLRKALFGILVASLLFSMLTLAFKNQPVEMKASIGYPVHNLDTGLNYTTIQEAIDASATLDGHTILVDPGTYYENVVVNKTLTLVGGDKDSTIIDGNQPGTVVTLTADGVNFTDFTISGNTTTVNNYIDISLSSNNNNIRGNNLVNGGFFNVQVSSSGNSISGNNIANSHADGIWLDSSSNNSISGNNITANGCGIVLSNSSDNKIYHNNFVNNGAQVEINKVYKVYNVWDDGYPSGGNYWSDYTGVDIHSGIAQDQPGSDGIGDTPCVIDVNNTDHYPLVHPWSFLPVHNMNTGLSYSTIQEAIDANETLAGHTIFVEAGTYYEHIVVEKSLKIYGENETTTIIDGNGTGRVLEVVNVNNVAVIGFRIRNGGPPWPCISLLSLYNTEIRDDIIENDLQGVDVAHCGDVRIVNCEVIAKNMGGILTYDINSMEIINCTITGSSATNLIGISTSGTNFILENNRIADNDIGIYSGSTSTVIRKNTIINNNRGIYVSSYCTGSNIYHNDFINNTIQVYNEGSVNAWDVGYLSGGNYWSDYNGTDLYHGPYQNETGSDGIGDLPYVIDANNTDRYPLMTPWFSTPSYLVGLAGMNVSVTQQQIQISIDLVNFGDSDAKITVIVSAQNSASRLMLDSSYIAITLGPGEARQVQLAMNVPSWAPSGEYIVQGVVATGLLDQGGFTLAYSQENAFVGGSP